MLRNSFIFSAAWSISSVLWILGDVLSYKAAGGPMICLLFAILLTAFLRKKQSA